MNKIVYGESFNHIVSLGGKCQTAFQINRYFYDNQKTSGYFNWLETPTRSLIDILEAEFDQHHELRNLKSAWEGKALTCDLYGLGHIHDYDAIKIGGDKEAKIDFSKMAEQHNIVKEKFNHLVGSFRNLKGNILFIRAGSGNHVGFDQNCELDEVLIRRLHAALKKNLHEDVNFKILLVDLGSRESFYNPANFIPAELKSSIFADHVQWYSEPHERWQGSDQGWDEMLNRWQIKLIT